MVSFVWTVISLFVTGVISETYYDYSAVLSLLKSKKAEWTSKGINNYVYQYSTGCFCPQCWTLGKYVVVKDGVITNVEFDQIALSKLMSPTSCSDSDIQTPYDSNYDTISDLYDEAIAFAQDGAEKCSAPTTTSKDLNSISFGDAKCGGNIVFEYHDTLFYPTILGLHLGPNIMDGDITYNIGCLTNKEANAAINTGRCDNYPQSTTPTTTKSTGTETTLSAEDECIRKGFGCLDPISGECSQYAPCPYREYCTIDENSEFYLECDAYPHATCKFTGCGGCTEYFVDYNGDIVDCDANICELPSEVGPCRALIPKYFFNSETGACEQFTYGGCNGNANNFETLENCQTECGTINECETIECITTPCIQPKPCPDGYTCIKNKCIEDSITTTAATETTTDICQLAAEVGPCDAAFPRYYFNSEKGECQEFTYGGCEGNENNFETLADCQNECSTDICQLPAESGMCLAYFPRYYYNSEKGECEEFIYGGCGGNDNRFETLKDCEAECKVEETSSTETPTETTKDETTTKDEATTTAVDDSTYCDEVMVRNKKTVFYSDEDDSSISGKTSYHKIDICKYCLCSKVGQRICNKCADFQNWDQSDIFSSLVDVFTEQCLKETNIYPALAADTDGTQCEWVNVRVKDPDDIEGCDCTAFYCEGTPNYNSFYSNQATQYHVLIGIGFVMTLFSWM